MKGWDVTVVVPSIPPRVPLLLPRALNSILAQTRIPDAVHLEVDTSHRGAAATRNRGLAAVRTEWTAFLDDDDELLPSHLEHLLACAHQTGADLVYPWFRVPNGFDPLGRKGLEFDPKLLDSQNYIPVTVLVRTEMIRASGGFIPHVSPENPCEDWGAWLALRDAGAKIVHLDEVTWLWHWHNTAGGNTSGRPDVW